MTDSDSDKEMEVEKCGKKLKKFSLVQFIHKGPKRSIESIDVIPSKWLSFEKNKCMTKYMAPPYCDEDYDLINNLIKLNVDAPLDWPTFPVAIKGEANNYNQALEKVNDLTMKDHVWSSESEESATEAQKDFINRLKQSKLLQSSEKSIAKYSSQKKQKKDEPKAFPSKKQKVDSERNHENDSGQTPELLTGQSNTFDESNLKEDNCANIFGNDALESNELDEPTVNETSETKSLENVDPNIKKNVLHELNVPVINFAFPCKQDFEIAVIRTLTQLKIDMDHMKSTQAELNNKCDQIISSFENMQNFLIDKKVVQGCAEVNFEKKYNIKIPLVSIDDFEKFNSKLQSDTYFRNDVYKDLAAHIDKDLVISRSIVKMLKKFLTKELALKFTAVRSSADKSKIKFKNTPFCNLIDAVIIRSRNEKSMDTKPDELISCLSDVLCNVKRWTDTV